MPLPNYGKIMSYRIGIQARHYFSRKLKWDPSDFSGEKSRGDYCLRLPGFVLRPLRRTTSRCYAVRHGYRNDLTPCRMALYFDYASAHAPTPSKHPASTATRGSSYTAPLALRFLYSFKARTMLRVHKYFVFLHHYRFVKSPAPGALGIRSCVALPAASVQ